MGAGSIDGLPKCSQSPLELLRVVQETSFCGKHALRIDDREKRVAGRIVKQLRWRRLSRKVEMELRELIILFEREQRIVNSLPTHVQTQQLLYRPMGPDILNMETGLITT